MRYYSGISLVIGFKEIFQYLKEQAVIYSESATMELKYLLDQV